MYWATDPSLVTRVAFLAATETPFVRRITTACSISPLASVRACLQSIIGAPVFSRRSFTCAAEIFTVVVLIFDESFFYFLLFRRDLACYCSPCIVPNDVEQDVASGVSTFDAALQTLTRAGRPAR